MRLSGVIILILSIFTVILVTFIRRPLNPKWLLIRVKRFFVWVRYHLKTPKITFANYHITQYINSCKPMRSRMNGILALVLICTGSSGYQKRPDFIDNNYKTYIAIPYQGRQFIIYNGQAYNTKKVGVNVYRFESNQPGTQMVGSYDFEAGRIVVDKFYASFPDYELQPVVGEPPKPPKPPEPPLDHYAFWGFCTDPKGK